MQFYSVAVGDRPVVLWGHSLTIGPWKMPTLAESPLKSNCPVTGLRSSWVGASPNKPSPQGNLQQPYAQCLQQLAYSISDHAAWGHKQTDGQTNSDMTLCLCDMTLTDNIVPNGDSLIKKHSQSHVTER